MPVHVRRAADPGEDQTLRAIEDVLAALRVRPHADTASSFRHGPIRLRGSVRPAEVPAGAPDEAAGADPAASPFRHGAIRLHEKAAQIDRG